MGILSKRSSMFTVLQLKCMKPALIIVITLFLFPIHNLLGQDSLRIDFFPLEIGNRWEYDVFSGNVDTGDVFIEVIGDTVLANGVQYFIVSEDDNITFLRITDSLQVVEFNPSFEKEFLLYKLDVPVGEFWEREDLSGETFFTTLVSIHDTTILGKTTKIMELHTGPEPFSNLFETYLANGLGCVNSSGENITTQLKGAIISGVRYGIITEAELAEYTTDRVNKDPVLLEIYPNPFNSYTTIRYILSYHANISIEVRNTHGKPVRTLFRGPQGKGTYSVSWDGRNEEGLEVSSGLYFLVFRCKRHDIIRRLIFLK